MKILSYFSVLLLFAASCASLPKNSDNVTRQLKCGPGPEDMVLDSTSSSPRLLISCSQRRTDKKHPKLYPAFAEIMEYRFDGQEAKTLPRTGEPAGFVFNPHGIDIITVKNETYLYVVNHRDDINQHYIVQYIVQADKLVFKQQFTSAFMVSPNDCVAAPYGRVYVTNDSGKRNALGEKLFKKKRANVVMFDSLGNCSVVAEKLAYANGLYVDKDTVVIPNMTVTSSAMGDDTVFTKQFVVVYALYVSTVQQKALFRYKVNADGTLKVDTNIAPYFGYDNITRYGDELIVVAHPKPLKFLAHMKNAKKPSPGITYAIKNRSKEPTTRVLFADDGKRVSCNSTGLIYKNRLYICQVFEPFILEVDLK
jgi:hypothetical protein